MSSVTEQLRDLARLKEHRDDAKADYEEYKRRHAELEAELIERMAEEGVDSLKADGVNFIPAKTAYGSVNDRAAFIAWAKESGHDDLIEEKERKQLVNQLAREHLDDGNPLPPGMSFYVKEYISQRAS